MSSKSILITGASTGFGKLAVQMLLERGHRVIAGIRGGQSRAESIFGSELLSGGRLKIVDLHMDQTQSINEAVKFVHAEFDGSLDVLINNAGYGLLGPVGAQTEEEIRRQMEVNFFGPVLLTNALRDALIKARGRILNISSVAGIVTFPFYGTYAASKHALDALSESLSYELKPFGVQVGLIEPGGFKTDFMHRSLAYGKNAMTEGSLYKKRVENFDHFLKSRSEAFLGDPKRVARLIVKLSEKKKIPIRTLIGIDAWSMGWVKRLFPHSLRMFLEDLVFRKLVFRE